MNVFSVSLKIFPVYFTALRLLSKKLGLRNSFCQKLRQEEPLNNILLYHPPKRTNFHRDLKSLLGVEVWATSLTAIANAPGCRHSVQKHFPCCTADRYKCTYLALVKRKKGFERNEIVPVNDEVVFGLLGIPVHGLSFKKMKGNFGGRSPRGIVIDPME